MRIAYLNFVLNDGLLCMILMTLLSRDCWSYMILWICLTMVHLTWSFGGRFDHDTQDILHYIEDVAPLIQDVARPNDWRYLVASSHASWTLDDG